MLEFSQEMSKLLLSDWYRLTVRGYHEWFRLDNPFVQRQPCSFYNIIVYFAREMLCGSSKICFFPFSSQSPWKGVCSTVIFNFLQIIMVSLFLASHGQYFIMFKDSNIFEFTNFPFKTKYNNAVVYSLNINYLFARRLHYLGKQE